jgi:hypothetical protein
MEHMRLINFNGIYIWDYYLTTQRIQGAGGGIVMEHGKFQNITVPRASFAPPLLKILKHCSSLQAGPGFAGLFIGWYYWYRLTPIIIGIGYHNIADTNNNRCRLYKDNQYQKCWSLVLATSGWPTPKIVLLFRALAAPQNPRNRCISHITSSGYQKLLVHRCRLLFHRRCLELPRQWSCHPKFHRVGATPDSTSWCPSPPSTTPSPSLRTLSSPMCRPPVAPVLDSTSRSPPQCLTLPASSFVGHWGALTSWLPPSPSTVPELPPDTMSFHQHLPL